MIGTGGERPSLFTGQPSHEQKSVLPSPSPILSISVPSSMRRSLTPDMEETLKLKAEKIKKEIDGGDAAEDEAAARRCSHYLEMQQQETPAAATSRHHRIVTNNYYTMVWHRHTNSLTNLRTPGVRH